MQAQQRLQFSTTDGFEQEMVQRLIIQLTPPRAAELARGGRGAVLYVAHAVGKVSPRTPQLTSSSEARTLTPRLCLNHSPRSAAMAVHLVQDRQADSVPAFLTSVHQGLQLAIAHKGATASGPPAAARAKGPIAAAIAVDDDLGRALFWLGNSAELRSLLTAMSRAADPVDGTVLPDGQEAVTLRDLAHAVSSKVLVESAYTVSSIAQEAVTRLVVRPCPDTSYEQTDS